MCIRDRSYSARVASSVGVMLCVIMGERRAEVLSRACDLGVAMQLTNIARDIGEDAKEGRLYIPHDWFQEEGIDPEEFLSKPDKSESTVAFTKRLLGKAETLYQVRGGDCLSSSKSKACNVRS